ncbi:hypothetical protein DSAG12_01428 [Promethearchaeum syntrophicum]|uniref:Uncharacterized protein n=1 Tax=Promethearchaeum syntrophicum TaxID=2594042 RepID=A0A5B9D926_9ARCH|nr:hypothetical protein [Candidatus Prometheoarchaeum syntrophicum]QEE15602.1 hypothetical protein DSAG12_01428 [Candidatus Prometheoarchaeum syntrophicum]
MAKKKKTTKAKKTIRTIACKHLKNIDEISNARKPLCYCTARKFNLSPYNVICQICSLYVENSSQLTHKEMYVATEAKDFQFDENDLEYSDDDFVMDLEEEEEDELEDEEEIIVKKKKSKKKSKKKVEDDDDDDDDFEIEKVTEEDEEELIIGHEKEEKEVIDYEDESEEGLGKKHGPLKESDEEDEEDEEFEEEIEDFDEKEDKSEESEEVSSIDFEAEVIDKIKKVGTGENIKEICPFCQKSKVSVLRHLSKCKRCPPEIISAYKIYKKK